MTDTHIALAHGNGGRLMRELIDEVFARCLDSPSLDTRVDAAPVPGPADDCELCVSTDGFTVQPLEYPGGDIGSLAVHGTVNDLAVSGATPTVLTVNAFVEEGLEIALLERLVHSMGQAARSAGVAIVAGDTKVLRRGEGGGVYFATTGLGVRARASDLGPHRIEAGDVLLISGPVGDHGAAVMLAREQFGLRGDVRSDAASVLGLTQALLDLDGLRFMRDPTRGGLATVVHEITATSRHGARLRETDIPVREPVSSVCEMLGYDPYYLACEGRVLAVLSPADADVALERWHAIPGGEQARKIGVTTTESPRVILETAIGGERYLEELEDDPLPRIC
ncbi:MAG: hydrogenase expression/formation protein HypE [Gammaproteobacteria bacterium]|nr:hydrogenase expression/formation protein HypE [Gammaproteobacteria bacterium]